MQTIPAWSADYVQVRTFSNVKVPVEAHGQIYTLASDRLRMNQATPAKGVLAINGLSCVCFLEPAAAVRFSLQGAPPSIHLVVPGPNWLTELYRHYTVSVERQTDRHVTLELHRAAKSSGPATESVHLRIRRSDWLIDQFKAEQGDGLFMKITFRNIDITRQYAPAYFEFIPPAGSGTTRQERPIPFLSPDLWRTLE